MARRRPGPRVATPTCFAPFRVRNTTTYPVSVPPSFRRRPLLSRARSGPPPFVGVARHADGGRHVAIAEQKEENTCRLAGFPRPHTVLFIKDSEESLSTAPDTNKKIKSKFCSAPNTTGVVKGEATNHGGQLPLPHPVPHTPAAEISFPTKTFIFHPRAPPPGLRIVATVLTANGYRGRHKEVAGDLVEFFIVFTGVVKGEATNRILPTPLAHPGPGTTPIPAQN